MLTGKPWGHIGRYNFFGVPAAASISSNQDHARHRWALRLWQAQEADGQRPPWTWLWNWVVVWKIFVLFSIYWVSNHPNWLEYFSEGWRETTNQESVVLYEPMGSMTFLCASKHQSRLQALAAKSPPGSVACVKWHGMISTRCIAPCLGLSDFTYCV